MINLRDESVEVSKADPCPICDHDHWCMHLKDGSVICDRVDIPPDGWIKSKAKAKDDRNIFHPKRNNAKPRMMRSQLAWRNRRSDGESGESELEMVFPYSATQRVIRRQWSDRRPAYTSKKTGRTTTKLVRPQYWSKEDEEWKWGKGPEPWPLYRIDEVQPGDVLFFVGGEMAVRALRRFGFSATCHQGGEGSYTESIAKTLGQLKFLMLVIVPDNDQHGWKAAQALLAATIKAGVPTSILDPKRLKPDADDKWDVADWEAGISVAQKTISNAVAELDPIIHTLSGTPEQADAIEAEVREIIKIQRPALRILREKQLMKDYGLKSTELKELKGYTSRYGNSSSHNTEDLFVEVFNHSELASQGKIATGIETGFKDLDALMSGLQKGRILTIGGRPGMGKSALALNIAVNVASAGHKTIYFSFEMPAKELMTRLISTTISVESQRINRGALEMDEWEKFIAVQEYLQNLPLIFSNPLPATLDAIETELENSEGIELVVIDYLQLMHGPGQTPLERLEVMTKNIKLNALHRNIPIILLSQLNRSNNIRASKRPQTTDLRGSGSIEQDSDIIGLLYREELDDPGTTERGVAELNICKNRCGPTGPLKLLYEGRFTRFANINNYEH